MCACSRVQFAQRCSATPARSDESCSAMSPPTTPSAGWPTAGTSQLLASSRSPLSSADRHEWPISVHRRTAQRRLVGENRRPAHHHEDDHRQSPRDKRAWRDLRRSTRIRSKVRAERPAQPRRGACSPPSALDRDGRSKSFCAGRRRGGDPVIGIASGTPGTRPPERQAGHAIFRRRSVRRTMLSDPRRFTRHPQSQSSRRRPHTHFRQRTDWAVTGPPRAALSTKVRLPRPTLMGARQQTNHSHGSRQYLPKGTCMNAVLRSAVTI
jgi:hypothetical protein